MKLSTEQIKAITVGAVSITEQDNGLYFSKCTEKQVAAWYNFSEVLGQRAKTTTGIRLDFHTNSQNVFLKVSGGKFDVYVDNLLRWHYKAVTSTEISLSLCDTLGDKRSEYRVTVYFPSHSIGVLEEIGLDDGAYAIKHTFERKMLFIGDSITQGWNADYDSLSYAYRVSRLFDAESVIQGIGGAFYHESTFDSIDFQPDAVVVAYGTNDFSRYASLEEFRGHVYAHLALIADEYAGKQIFVLSPIWRDKLEIKPMGSFAECRQAVADGAEKYGLVHIDGLSLVPPFTELFADGHLHPNDAGFAYYGENLALALRKYLK